MEIDGWEDFESSGDTDGEGDDIFGTSGKSNTWCVGKHNCCSFSCAKSEFVWDTGPGESVMFEPIETGGDGGKG